MPYHIRDPKRDHNIDNHPHVEGDGRGLGLSDARGFGGFRVLLTFG